MSGDSDTPQDGLEKLAGLVEAMMQVGPSPCLPDPGLPRNGRVRRHMRAGATETEVELSREPTTDDLDARKLFCGNISFGSPIEAVYEHFSRFGELEDVCPHAFSPSQ